MASHADELVVSAAENVRILRELGKAIDAGRPVALATVVETRRSVPRRAGTKMLVFEDGQTVGTVGGGEMEAQIVASAVDAIRRGRPRLEEIGLVNPAQGDPGICGGELKLYLEPYMPPHTVYIIGCGHVGRTVVDLAHWLGYRTVAIDDRSELVTEEAMPHADVRFVGSVTDALAAYPVTKDSSIISVTRSTAMDVATLPELIATPARYIGVMGSRTRWKATRDQLIDNGADAGKIDLLHVPIGIELNAETLEEIAVSIMAEVIQVNRAEEA